MTKKLKTQKSRLRQGFGGQANVKSGTEEELKNQLARALADYDNLRKRTEAERQVWMKFAKQSLLVRLLPVLDTLEVAQNHLKDKGLEISMAQFKNILKEEGIEEITQVSKFDENIHEAVDVVEKKVEDPERVLSGVEGRVEGEIAEVLQKGYKFNDGEVIRPAKVRVYKGK